MVSLSDTIFEIVADLAGILGAVGLRRGAQNHHFRVRIFKKCEKSGPEHVLEASGKLNEKMKAKMKKNGRLGGVRSLIFYLFYKSIAFSPFWEKVRKMVAKGESKVMENHPNPAIWARWGEIFEIWAEFGGVRNLNAFSIG